MTKQYITDKINGLVFPAADGVAGQVLATDGSGSIGWATLPSAGATTSISTNSTLATSYNVLYFNSTSAMTLNLPSVTSTNDYSWAIKNINLGQATISVYGSDLIDGEASQTLNQYEAIMLYSNGVVWSIL